MRLLCNGVALDLEAGATMSFKKLNPLFAFDKLTCERTQSFNLPATPTNDLVLELAKIPAYYGAGMRRRFDAELQDGTVVKQGYLYVDKYGKGKYSAVFVTGELFGLLKIKGAGKIPELITCSEVVSWSYGNVPSLPQRAHDTWSLTAYRQLGGFIHPSYLVKAIVDKVVSAQALPAITLPANAQGLRVIPGVLKTLAPTGLTFARRPDGYFADVTQTYPYPRVSTLAVDDTTVSGLFTTVNYDVSYRRHWEDYDFQQMSPVLRTVTYGGNVQHLVCNQAVKVTFASDFPADVYIGTFNDAGSYMGGFNFYGDRSFYKNWYSGQAITRREGEPLAGRTISLEAGTAFVFVKESDLLDYTRYTEDLTTHETWEQGWKNVRDALNVTGVTFEGDGDAVIGNSVRLQDNLPAVTLVDLLKAIAGLTGKALNYTDAEGVTFDDLTVDTWPTVEIRQPLGTDEVARTFSDYAQLNTLRFDTDASVSQGARIVSAYVVDNDNLEAEKELQVIPFSEGAAAYDESGVELVEVQEDNESDTIANADTTAARMARAVLPLNPNLAALCQASTAIALRARMTLQEYEALAAKVTILYAGTRYVWTEAQYSKGVVTLKLSKIPA